MASKQTEIMICVRPGRVRTALIEDRALVDLIVEDTDRGGVAGNVYLGRVEKILGHMGAAFVDIGLARSGFLALPEARPVGAEPFEGEGINDHLAEGDRIVVQVLRDPFEDKGAKLSRRIALTGRQVILTPDDPAIRISRRIADEAARSRLQALLAGYEGDGNGFIVRTAAAAAGDAEIEADAAELSQAWATICSDSADAQPPALLHSDGDAVLRTLRDLATGDISRIVIDDADAVARAKTYCRAAAPGLEARIVHYMGAKPLFEEEEAGGEPIAAAIEEALRPEIALPSGGSVIFSETPALVAIDVNAAGAGRGRTEDAALAVNLEAARLIAWQLRLRNLSGLIAIDFLKMKSEAAAAKVVDAVKVGVAGDPSPVFVGGFTRFGLLEMTRRRRRQSLKAQLTAHCEMCEGHGYVASGPSAAHAALDAYAADSAHAPGANRSLLVSPEIAEALEGPVAAALDALNARIGRPIDIETDGDLAVDGFEIVAGEGSHG